MERPATPQGSNQIFILIGSIRRQLVAYPCSALLLGLILVVPSLLLSASTLTPTLNRRGTAELFEITRNARLVQSFEADPTSPVPLIWQKRLSPDAALAQI